MNYEDDKKGDEYTTNVAGVGNDQGVLPEAHYNAGGAEDVETTVGLKRQLKSRHMAMISIGGVIGTGLFLGTGNALANGGPLGLFLGYCTMGTICYSVMVSPVSSPCSPTPIRGSSRPRPSAC